LSVAKKPRAFRSRKPNPAQALAVIHNELARASHAMGIGALRLVMLLAERIRQDQELLSHRFRVADYADQIGLNDRTGSLYDTMERVCDQLLTTKVETRRDVNRRTKFTLVTTAHYFDGEGEIELQFHEEMRPLLVSLREYFSRIPLDVFFRIKSAHAARFYLVCKSWDPQENHSPHWRFTIQELRAWLMLRPDEYRHTPHLRSAILERAKQELDEVADVSFRYTPYKENGVTAGWDFVPVTNRPTRRKPPALPAPAESPEPPPQPDYGSVERLWAEASQEQRKAWLEDDLLRMTAPKTNEKLRLTFLARLHALTQPAEAAPATTVLVSRQQPEDAAA
jgi:hypothetical protein